ncbi:hypothetical protein N9L83_02835 [Flavobacteriales bacterium]|nr:hypothetical protein [Flavobacteriales bacterium]
MRYMVFILWLGCSWSAAAQGEWWFDTEERERDITGVDKRDLSERPSKERLTLGGTAALQLGSVTLIGGAPQLGYRFTENLVAGAGATYYFNRFKDIGYTQHLYGVNVFARHRLITRVFAHIESEAINLELSGPFNSLPERQWVSMLWVGGGYYRGLSDRLGAGVTILYDVTENPLSPYDNPTLRGGIAIGF